jgi:2-iminobutanoate/2-iminopropanoate deaminase
MKKIIYTQEAPAAVGPYSQAIEAGNMLFISGQVPLVPGLGKLVEGSISEQTHQVLKNIGAILKTTGLTYDNVVKTTCLLADMNDFKAMNEVYATYFTTDPPARAAFQVCKLPLGALIEIEAIAMR